MAEEKLNETEREELDRLRKSDSKELYCKVSHKGAVSVYGLGRFPVTLYSGQWERVFSFVDTIKEFIVANKSNLSVKE